MCFDLWEEGVQESLIFSSIISAADKRKENQNAAEIEEKMRWKEILGYGT